MPGIEPGPIGWYTSNLTTGLQEVLSGIVVNDYEALFSGNYSEIFPGGPQDRQEVGQRNRSISIQRYVPH